MKKSESELKVITESKRLTEYIMTISEKSPKKYRYTYVNRIHNLLFNIIELLYKANNEVLGSSNRSMYQNDVYVKFQFLDYLCDLGCKEKCILFKQYENITEMINTCMKLLSNWITSDKRRINNILG